MSPLEIILIVLALVLLGRVLWSIPGLVASVKTAIERIAEAVRNRRGE